MADLSESSSLNERAQRLFKVLVERYISEGEPVGSRTLARDSGLDLSPATVRNVMADLEDLGLVVAPHTSAGRVPTVRGYRLFVDSLLKISPLRRGEINKLRSELTSDHDPEALLATASQLLSEISHMAGVVTLPRRQQMVLRQVEFLSLSANRVLVIMVAKDGHVQNRILHTDRAYSRSQLEHAAKYLTSHYVGKELEVIREQIVQEMHALRERVTREMRAIVEMAERTFEVSAERSGYLVSGQTNLMGFSELASVEQLKELFEAFNEKREMLHLFNHTLSAQGVQIFIGEESGYQVLDRCSVVTSPYTVDGETVGVLGIVGPTRMHYDRVIPIVDVTAKLLSAALNPRG